MPPDYQTDFLFEPDIMYSIWTSVSIPVMVVREKDLIVLEANPQAKSVFSGVCPCIPGTRLDTLGIWPDDKESKEFLGKLKAEEKIENYELRLQIDKKRLGDFLISTDTMEISGIRYKLVMMRDVSELKAAEHIAKEMEILYESAVNNLKELIIIHDKGKILFANEIFKKTFDIKDNGHLGRQVQAFIKFPRHNDLLKPEENVLSGTNKRGLPDEIKLSTADGIERHYSFNSVPLKYSDHEVQMTMLIDITERKSIEQAMMAKALESAEFERNLLVVSLHDDLGPDLSTIRLLLSSIDQLARNEEPLAPRLAQCLSYIDSVISKLKSITADITPDVIDRFGLHSSLAALIDRLTSGKTLHIHFKSNIQNIRFPSKVEINLYRVIFELIENTLEHSGASQANLKIRYGCNELSVVYKDDGKGFDIENISPNDSGSGIMNMINRINSLNGKIDFKDYKGQVITVIKVSSEPER